MSSRLLGRAGESYLKHHIWTIESGIGLGIKLNYPQNLEFLSGESELPVQQTLAEHIRPGDVVYDIGANVGFFSLIAARLAGPSGTVCAFEPVAENARSILQNARLNSLGNLQVFEVAVGMESQIGELLLTDWDGGSTLAGSAVMPAMPVSRRIVQVAALDEFIVSNNLRSPDFIKIDVEGVELDVIKGMSKTLERSKPILLYEVDDGNKASFERRWSELDTYVAQFGYAIFRLESSYLNKVWHVGHSIALQASNTR